MLSTEKQERTLEIALLIVVTGLAALLFRSLLLQSQAQSMVVLNLFYLPVGVAAFFLGRYRAGVLAFFCVITVAMILLVRMDFASSGISPLQTALNVTFWAAVLGLDALLVGTMSDERMVYLRDLHDAHVGVVEVLSRYLTGADARIRDRTQRVADLSQRVAVELKLTPQEFDDIGVAALLQDLGSFEVTSKVIRRAVDDLSRDSQRPKAEHTFCGSDFAQSLGSVLTGALQLMYHERDPMLSSGDPDHPTSNDSPMGARILHTIRAYCRFTDDASSALGEYDATAALRELKSDVEGNHDPAVLMALERVVLHDKTTGSYSDRLEAALKGRKKFGRPDNGAGRRPEAAWPGGIVEAAAPAAASAHATDWQQNEPVASGSAAS